MMFLETLFRDPVMIDYFTQFSAAQNVMFVLFFVILMNVMYYSYVLKNVMITETATSTKSSTKFHTNVAMYMCHVLVAAWCIEHIDDMTADDMFWILASYTAAVGGTRLADSAAKRLKSKTESVATDQS